MTELHMPFPQGKDSGIPVLYGMSHTVHVYINRSLPVCSNPTSRFQNP